MSGIHIVQLNEQSNNLLSLGSSPNNNAGTKLQKIKIFEIFKLNLRTIKT